MTTSINTTNSHSTTSNRSPVFAGLTGLTTLAIFAQAVIAGQFVSQDGKDNWISAHNITANLVVGLALITAVFAAVTMRHVVPRLVGWSVVLFVLTVAQTAIGHQITDASQDALIAVHVPLAFVIFGLTLWLSIQAVQMRSRQPVSMTSTHGTPPTSDDGESGVSP